MIYRNVEIFVGNGEIIKNGFISTKNGRIEKVEEMVKFEKKYENGEILDLSDFVVYPGFVDSHCHVGMWETALNFEGDDVNEETDPILPNLRAIDAINPLDDAFNCAIKQGITTVVTGPGSGSPISGNFLAMKTFGNCIDDMIVKNPVGIKFALGENPKTVYGKKKVMPMTRMGVAALIRNALEKAKRYEEKLKKGEKPCFDAKCEALIPLLNREIKAFFHCHRADDIFTAIRIAKEFSLDFVLVHGTEGYLIAEKLEGVDVLLGPLMAFISKPELKEESLKNPYILNKNNVNIAIATDAPILPIQFLTLSCSLAVKNGLSRNDAIMAITKNPAVACGIYDRVGSIETEKDADFVGFRKGEDIFSPYVDPSFVVLNGKMVFKNF